MTELVFSLPDQAATAQLAAVVGRILRAGDILALEGDLGAGKTTFARALIQHLNPAETEVPSPTFTLLQSYKVPQGNLFHYDLYRLAAPEEVYALDWDDARKGIILVEWPSRLGTLLPADHLTLKLEHTDNENSRRARLLGPSERLSGLEVTP